MRVIILFLFFLFPLNSYSQNVFRFIGKGAALKVTRTITTNQINMALARSILAAHTGATVRVIDNVTVQATFSPGIVTPAIVLGPNSYLRGVSQAFKGATEWQNVNLGTGYNGAHHIVTKFVIKQIGGSDEAIRNGPSVFHPLHNRPEYVDAFHNHQRQLEIYKVGGIKGIVQDFFDRVPGFTDDEIKVMLLESELWAKHWGLKWQ